MTVVNTTISSPYFLHALELIGSILKNSPSVDLVQVWDIGLTDRQIRSLGNMEKVCCKPVPPFAEHWKECYSWKLYVLQHAEEDLVLHIDAKTTVLKELEPVFNIISDYGYFCVGQGHSMDFQTPHDYWDTFGVPESCSHTEAFHAGIIGYKKNTPAADAVRESYEACLSGYNLGYSEQELFKDRFSRNQMRDCECFRQDQTLLNLLFRKHISELYLQNVNLYACVAQDSLLDQTVIFNHRGVGKIYSHVFKVRFLESKISEYARLVYLMCYANFKRFLIRLKKR